MNKILQSQHEELKKNSQHEELKKNFQTMLEKGGKLTRLNEELKQKLTEVSQNAEMEKIFDRTKEQGKKWIGELQNQIDKLQSKNEAYKRMA